MLSVFESTGVRCELWATYGETLVILDWTSLASGNEYYIGGDQGKADAVF